MSRARFSPNLIAAIIVALFLGVALYLRIALPYDQVFSGDWIKFTGVDGWYHMRIVDNLVHNFPHFNSFDPYLLYPGGMEMSHLRLFDYLLAGIIWLVGLGSPTQHTVDIVGAYLPAVLGALTVIPVYFIGKALFNRWAGVIAAGLVALLPGEFLGRSILGFVDHHVAEILFTTVAIMFLILGIKAGRDRLTFDRLWHGQWTTIAKPLIYSILAGVFLGAYFITWQGALLFVFIIFVYLVIQFVIDHWKNRSADYLCFSGTITFLVTLLIALTASLDKLYLVSLLIATVAPMALVGLSRLMASRGIKPILYPVAMLGLGLVSLAIFYIIDPILLESMLGRLAIFNWPVETAVLEMQPLLMPLGNFTLSLAWGNFTTGFFLTFISLGILIYFVIKRGETDKTLLVVWSLVMLAATLSMRRFAYYFVINVALLTGYLSWLILEFTGFKRLAAKPGEISGGMPGEKVKKRGITGRHVYMALGVVVVFFLSFFPNISPAIATASHTPFAPSDAWCESLTWLRDNTPEPFGDPAFYYELYEPPPPGESYDYPETAYGVTAWWDCGYWVTRMGHRIPTANPGVGHKGEAYIFTAQDDLPAENLMARYSSGSRYVIVDYALTNFAGKFPALASIGGGLNTFLDVYYIPGQDGSLSPVLLYYPEYYRSLAVRLYNFDGKEVTPQESIVIAYQQSVTSQGEPYMAITDVQFFDSYEEAEAYISSQESGNYRLVSDEPLSSPVPLAALERYELVYSSDSMVAKLGGSAIPEVKIFKFTPLPAPAVQSLPAISVSRKAAILVGELTRIGEAPEVTVSFLWGTTEDCEEAEFVVGVMDSVGQFTYVIDELTPNTTYYYKVKAVGYETVYGSVQSFTTAK